MRRPSTFLRRRGNDETNLTPMIDMVFLLMIYFVWTYGSSVAEHLLPSAVTAIESPGQAAVPRERPEIAPLVVRLTNVGGRVVWTIDGAPALSLAAVRQSLASVAQIKNDVPLIVHPDRDVPLGDVIDVYDIARTVGLNKIQFAAAR